MNLQGTGWHSAGNFQAAVEQLDEVPSGPEAIAEQESNPVEALHLSEEAKELLVAAVKDKFGMTYIVRTMGGVSISSNGKEFAEMGNRRSEAKWEQAVLDLLNHGLVNDPKGKGEVFEVTHLGFQIADILGE